MRIAHRSYAKTCCRYLLLMLAVFVLLACNTRENQLTERETMISARESELVTLFAEMTEQKKLLEKNDSKDLPDTMKNSTEKTCACDSNPLYCWQPRGSTRMGRIQCTACARCLT
jgi:long-subunit acyl-CoA synthetase (AMP-forming)